MAPMIAELGLATSWELCLTELSHPSSHSLLAAASAPHNAPQHGCHALSKCLSFYDLNWEATEYHLCCSHI